MYTEYSITKDTRFLAPLQVVESLIGFGLPLAMVSSDSPYIWTECYVDESRYQLKNNYKITLRAVDTRFGYENYYMSDLQSLINRGLVFILSPDDNYIPAVIRWRDGLCTHTSGAVLKSKDDQKVEISVLMTSGNSYVDICRTDTENNILPNHYDIIAVGPTTNWSDNMISNLEE